MADVLAERRGLAPEAPGPRGRGLHGRRGAVAAAAAEGVAPRQQRARLLDGGPHCDSPRRRGGGVVGDSNSLLAGHGRGWVGGAVERASEIGRAHV